MSRDEFYRDVGGRIQAARRRSGLAQKELALHLDLSRESISNIENGRHAVQLHVLAAIAHVLELEVGELIPPVALSSRSARDVFAARVMGTL